LKDAGIEIVNGIVKIAQLMVKTLVVEKNSDQTQSSIGEGIIKANEISVMIESNQVLPSSKIFVTFRTDYGSRWWIGYQEKGRFIVNIAEPLLDDVKFDWWIVQTEQVEVTETSQPAVDEIVPVSTPIEDGVPDASIGTGGTPTDNVGAEETIEPVVPTSEEPIETVETEIIDEPVTDSTATEEPVTIAPETPTP
jgi:hypothetical protein